MTAGFKIICFESLGSTNDYLKENVTELDDYTVVWARDQHSGRGRFSRKWLSEKGEGLTFSVSIPVVDYEAECIGGIPLAAGLSAAAALKGIAPVLSPRIKWPNDILLNRKKAGGILCERVGDNVVAGLGININTRQENLDSIDIPATSLSVETQCGYKLSDVLERFLESFKPRLDTLLKEGVKGIKQELDQYLYVPDHDVIVIDWDREFKGRIVGVNESGELLFRDDTEGLVTFNSGEVSFSGISL
ncbi:MAG: biotin--[acetyl-CoA-carboxylase] ligase [Chitinivibrionales bacterium]